MGDARTELFHYEVRSTYDTPEVAESRRIVEEAQRQDSFTPEEPEDDEPWRHTPRRMKGFYAALIGVVVVGPGRPGLVLTRPRTTAFLRT